MLKSDFTMLTPVRHVAALSQRVSTSSKAKNIVAGEDEEDFEDEQPLLEPFTNLSLHKPSTSRSWHQVGKRQALLGKSH